MTTDKFVFHTSDRREEEFLSFVTEGSKLINFLTKKERRTSTDDYSYRVLNHWTKLGIIDEQRKQEKGWRRFSLLEIIWLQIVKELRNFGFSNESILEVKDSLQTYYSKSETISESNYFQYYVGLAMLQKISSFILVTVSGKSVLSTYSDITYSEMIQPTPNHIRISLNAILQKIFPEKNFEPSNDRQMRLNKEELDLLFEIRMNNVESIKVKTNEGKISFIELDERVNDKSIFELLKDEKYQNLEVKQRDGKVVAIKRTIRKKFD